jgi:hypothetical protein
MRCDDDAEGGGEVSDQTFEVYNVRGRGLVGGWKRGVFVEGREIGSLSFIIGLFRLGMSCQELSSRFNVQPLTVENIIRRAMREEKERTK